MRHQIRDRHRNHDSQGEREKLPEHG